MKQAAIELTTLAAVALCASTEETRYYLNGVCLEIEPRATTYVATDGHRMIARRLELAKDSEDNTLTGVFIVPTANCGKVGGKSRFGYDRHASLQEDGTGRLTINYGGAELHTFRPIDGVFPDWRRVIPHKRETEKMHVRFNTTYALSFDKIGAALGLGLSTIVPNNGAPALVAFAQDHNDLVAVLMPMRDSDHSAIEAPDWTKRYPVFTTDSVPTVTAETKELEPA